MTLASTKPLVAGRSTGKTSRGQFTTGDEPFRALADEVRRRIVERLAEGEAPMSELATLVGLSLPALHHHVAVLEQGRLVHCEKRGRVRWCRLGLEGLDRAEQWLVERRRVWMRSLDVLESTIAEQPAGGGERPVEPRAVPLVQQIAFRQCGSSARSIVFPDWRLRVQPPLPAGVSIVRPAGPDAGY